MRLGTVIGRVTLSRTVPALIGARWLIVSPFTREHFQQGADAPRGLSKDPSLVVYDDLGGGVGQTIGFIEGREAACAVRSTHPRRCHQRGAGGPHLLQPLQQMKQVISVRDLEEMLRNGKDVRSLPADALLTPSARDFLRELETSGNQQRTAGRKRQALQPGHARHLQEFKGRHRSVLQLAADPRA